MTRRPLSTPNLVDVAAPAALEESELAAREALWQRLHDLCAADAVRATADDLGFGLLLTREPGLCRLADLAVAVFRLENLTDESRSPLPALTLMDGDDEERHPGFDGVEQEAFDEDVALLSTGRAGR